MHADIDVSARPKHKNVDKARESGPFMNLSNDSLRGVDHNGGIFLRTNWQIQGYLLEQADAIEK